MTSFFSGSPSKYREMDIKDILEALDIDPEKCTFVTDGDRIIGFRPHLEADRENARKFKVHIK